MIGPRSNAGAAVEAHWSLNAVNAYAVEQLAELGAGLVWLSPELSGRQIAEVCAATRPVPLGMSVWGRQEVMVTEHCVLMAEGECDRRCGACARRGAAPRCCATGRATSSPCRPTSPGARTCTTPCRSISTAALPEILETGVAALRLDVQTESPRDAAAAVAAVVAAREAVMAGRRAGRAAQPASDHRGHFFRGLT